MALKLETGLVVCSVKLYSLSTVSHQTVKGYLSYAHYHIGGAAQTFEGPAVELGKKNKKKKPRETKAKLRIAGREEEYEEKDDQVGVEQEKQEFKLKGKDWRMLSSRE